MLALAASAVIAEPQDEDPNNESAEVGDVSVRAVRLIDPRVHDRVTDDAPLDDLVLECGGVVTNVLGDTQSCSDAGNIWRGYSLSVQWDWTILARGTNSATLADVLGTYIVGGCAAPLPPIDGSDISCDAGAVRNFFIIGKQTMRSTQTYNECPWSLLGCAWGVTMTLDD